MDIQNVMASDVVDESKMIGNAEGICYAETEEDIINFVKWVIEKSSTITIQGSKTGLVGGSVPNGGYILNLTKYNKIEAGDANSIIAQSGATLLKIGQYIDKHFSNLRFIPNPTESSATIGGIVSNNSRGLNRYGEVGQYIKNIKVLLETLKIVDIKPGEELFDLVVGGEGLYGVILEVELELSIKPADMWAIAFFFEEILESAKFVDQIKGYKEIVAIELLDKNVIKLIQQRREMSTQLAQVPVINDNYAAMIYIEIEGLEEDIMAMAEQLLEIAAECNSNVDDSWVFSGLAEMQKIRNLRHAAVEVIGMEIEKIRLQDSRIMKLSSDIANKKTSASDLVKFYLEDKINIEYCMFGHIGSQNIQVNLLPKTYLEYIESVKLMKKWAKDAIKEGGKIVAEQGYGKLKPYIYGKEIMMQVEQQNRSVVFQ
ncbi:FAD-binding oxidoreductase [Candidatus Epulonipiscium viviparus]|uniref:FAD-binding oxidoreductase n=1 Tax=Candidatus Epulonipiscium viviparus TaxID=420336 RepID=UPI00016C09DE|nr:FAD-binding oxidoreductase [Candidatus Epulopiscium viviparus]